MGYLTRLLVCLSMLGTAACVPDVVTAPAPVAPAPEAAAQSVSDAGNTVQAAPKKQSGRPTILLRELNSVRRDPSATLLYVIDGVITREADALHRLEADDIESIEVLKRASAEAIYSNQAWDAVILVTTRNARQSRSGT